MSTCIQIDKQIEIDRRMREVKKKRGIFYFLIEVKNCYTCPRTRSNSKSLVEAFSQPGRVMFPTFKQIIQVSTANINEYIQVWYIKSLWRCTSCFIHRNKRIPKCICCPPKRNFQSKKTIVNVTRLTKAINQQYQLDQSNFSKKKCKQPLQLHGMRIANFAALVNLSLFSSNIFLEPQFLQSARRPRPC